MTSLNLNDIDALIPSIQSTIEDVPSTPVSTLSEDITNYSPKDLITSEPEQEQPTINADPRIVALGLQGKLTSLENQNLTSDEWNAIYNRNRFVYEHGAAALSELDAQTHQLINPYDAYITDDRSLLSQGRDIALGAGQGIVDSVLGTAALGASLIGANSLATGLAKTSETVKEMSSELLGSRYMNRARRGNAALNGAREILSERNYQKNIANGDDPVLAHLKQLGHDVANWGIHTWNDANAFESLTANALGSLLTAGGISSKLGKLGTLLTNSSKSTLGKAIGARLATTEGRTILQRAIGNEGITNAILESGGSFLSAVNTVENMTQEQLMSSEDFRTDVESYMKQGFSFDEAFKKAKTDLAASVGRIASLITVPIAATTGAIAHDVIRNPLAPFRKGTFKGNPLTQFVKASGKAGLEEMTEEGLQGTQQYGENLGLNVNDIDTPMWKGVGQNIIEGMMAGFASGAAGPTLHGMGRGLKSIGTGISERIKDNKVQTRAQATARTNEQLTQRITALRDAVINDPDFQDVTKIETEPEQLILSENPTELEQRQVAENKQKINDFRTRNGLLSVEEELAFDQKSPEEKAKQFQTDERTQKTIKWKLYNEFKDFTEKMITGDTPVNSNFLSSLEENDEEFQKILKTVTGREQLTPETKKLFNKTKALSEQIADVLEDSKTFEQMSGDNVTTPVQTLLDIVALAKYFKLGAYTQRNEYDKAVEDLLKDTTPDLVNVLTSTETDKAKIEEQINNLSEPEKALFKFITQVAAPSKVLQEQKENLFTPFTDLLNIGEIIPKIYEKSPKLQEWVTHLRANPDLANDTSLTDEEKQIYHTVNAFTLFMDDNLSSPENLRTNSAQINAQLRQSNFSADPTINDTIRNLYQIASTLLTDQLEFTQQNESTDIAKIHKELLQQKDSISKNKGIGVAITEHLLRLLQTAQEVGRAKVEYERNGRTQVAKQNLANAQNAFLSTYQDLYNFGWNQRNKLYALFASQAMFRDNPDSTESSDTSKTSHVYYNSYGHGKKNTYWSEENPSYRISAFYNAGSERSQTLRQAVEFELLSINSLLKEFAQSIFKSADVLGLPKNLKNLFEKLQNGIEVNSEVLGDNFENIDNAQAKEIYDKYSKLAKEKAINLVPTQQSKRTVTPTSDKDIDVPTQFLEIAKSFLDTEGDPIDLSKFNAIKTTNSTTITYDGLNVLRKEGTSWKTILDEGNEQSVEEEFSKEENDIIDKFIEHISSKKPQTIRKLTKNEVASSLPSNADITDIISNISDDTIDLNNLSAKQNRRTSTIYYQNKKLLSKKGTIWVSTKKDNNNKTIVYNDPKHIEELNKLFDNLLQNNSAKPETDTDTDSDVVQYKNNEIKEIAEAIILIRDGLVELDASNDIPAFSQFLEQAPRLKNVTLTLTKRFAKLLAALDTYMWLHHESFSQTNPEQYQKITQNLKKIHDIFKRNGYEFGEYVGKSLSEPEKSLFSKVQYTEETTEGRVGYTRIEQLKSYPIKDNNTHTLIPGEITLLLQNTGTTSNSQNPITISSLKQNNINLVNLQKFLDDFRALKEEHKELSENDFLQLATTELSKDLDKYNLTLDSLKRAGIITETLDNTEVISKEGLQQLDSLYDKIDQDLQDQVDEASNDVVDSTIDYQIQEYLDRNQTKKVFIKDKEVNLAQEYEENDTFKTNLINYIKERLNSTDNNHISDILILNNRAYIKALILDFINQVNKDNTDIGVISVSKQLVSDVKSILPLFSEEGNKILHEINEFFLKKEKLDEISEEKRPFISYLISSWNEINNSGFSSQVDYLNTLHDFIEHYLNNKTEKTTKTIPEKINNVFSLFRKEDENEQLETGIITFAQQFDTSGITDPKLKAEMRTFKAALTALFTTKPYSNNPEKPKLLNYTSDPVKLLQTIYNKIIENAANGRQEAKDFFENLSKYNTNIKSFIGRLEKSNQRPTETRPSLNEAFDTLFFNSENSLLQQIYTSLEQTYIDAYNEVKGTKAFKSNFYTEAGLLRLMERLDINKQSGVGQSITNRLPWIILTKEGKPELNKPLIQKAILGALAALCRKPTNYGNFDKNCEDLEKIYPGLPEDVKNIMARSSHSRFFYNDIKNAILEYTDLHFNSNLSMSERDQIIYTLVSDIIRSLENTGILTTHAFILSKPNNAETWSTYTRLTNEKDVTQKEYIEQIESAYRKAKHIRNNEAQNEVGYEVYFEFNPSLDQFYDNKRDEIQPIIEAFCTIQEQAPELIDTLVFPESNIQVLIGNEGKLPVQTTKLHTKQRLSKGEQENLKQRQEQPFYVNKEMLSIAKLMAFAPSSQDSPGNLIDIYLGRQNLSRNNDKVLKGVKATIEGRQLATQTDIRNMQNLLTRMLSESEVKDITDLAIHFPYVIQRMGRLMIEGFNPQSSKMFRELFLPSSEPVDLTSDQMNNIFLRAVSQSLGIKVQYIKSGADYYQIFRQVSSLEDGYKRENSELLKELDKVFNIEKINPETKEKITFLQEKAVEKYQELITSDEFQQAMDKDTTTGFNESALLENSKNAKIVKDFILTMKEYFPTDCTWVALHGITEYLRYSYYKTQSTNNNLSNEERQSFLEKLKNYSSQLYLEADGIASGASNSIFLFSTVSNYDKTSEGLVSLSDYSHYKFMLRSGGGLGINGSFAALMEQTGQKSNDDNYGANAQGLKQSLKDMILNPDNKFAYQPIVTKKTRDKAGNEFFMQKFRDNVIKVLADSQQQIMGDDFDFFLDPPDIQLRDYTSTSLSAYTYNFMALFGDLIPTITFNSLEDFDINRNFIKSPLTQYQYGAGALSIARGLIKGNNLYPGISNSLERKLTEYNLATGSKRDSLRKELLKTVYRLLCASAFSVKTELNFETNEKEFIIDYAKNAVNNFVIDSKLYKPLFKLITDLNSNKDIDTNFSLDPNIFNVLANNAKNIITETLSNIITEEMYGKEFAQNKKLLLGVNSFISMSYSSVYVDRTLQEVDKKKEEIRKNVSKHDKDILNRGVWLTPREQDAIRKELEDFLPEYAQKLDISNLLQQYKEADFHEENLEATFANDKRIKLQQIQERFPDNELLNDNVTPHVGSIVPYSGFENQRSMNMFNTYSGVFDLQIPFESGVMVLPQIVQGMAESAIMKIMTILNSKGLDVYDGYNMMLHQVLSLGSEPGLAERANQAVYEVWTKTNVFKFIGQRLDIFYKRFYGSDSQGTEYSKLFHANLNIPVSASIVAENAKFNLNDLAPLQQVFIRNMSSLITAIRELGPDLKRSINSVLNTANTEILSQKVITQKLLPVEGDTKEQLALKTRAIRDILLLSRQALLQAEQKIGIKQAIMHNLLDVSIDQMGGSARKYTHEANKDGYEYTTRFGQKVIIPKIRSYIEYKDQLGNFTVPYTEYLDNVFTKEYSNAFDVLQTNSKEFSLETLAQGTILEGVTSEVLQSLQFHQNFLDTLNSLIIPKTEENNERFYDYKKNLTKDVKITPVKEIIKTIEAKINSNTLKLSAEQKRIYRLLLHALQKSKYNGIFDTVQVLEPTAKFLTYFFSHIQNDNLRKAFHDLLSQNGIKIDWFNINSKELTKSVQNSYALFESFEDGERTITIFPQTLSQNLEYNEQYVLTMLHELTHAFLTSYMSQVLYLDPTTKQFKIRDDVHLSFKEKFTLNHVLDMFNQYSQVMRNNSSESLSIVPTTEEAIWTEFHEFLARSATYDYTVQALVKSNPQFQVAEQNTLVGKLKNITGKAAKALIRLLKTVLGLPDSNVVSDVFYETHRAIYILSKNASFYYQKNQRMTPEQNVQSLHMQALDYSKLEAIDQEIDRNKAFIDAVRYEEITKKNYPKELALVDDNGIANQKVNTSLHNIASLLRLSLDERKQFTSKAKELYTLLLKQPEKWTNIADTIQEFYNQLTPELVSEITSELPGTQDTITELTDILFNSLTDLSKLSTLNTKQKIHLNRGNFSMAIPIIIALNEISEPMRRITSKMTYSRMREKNPSANINQRIRDIAHNLYTIAQGQKGDQNVSDQLQNIRNEVELDTHLRFLDFVPSVNPVLDTIDSSFSKILSAALKYISRSQKVSLLQLLPNVMKANNYATIKSLDDFMVKIASHNPDSFFYSLLNEMLPSSNMKKAFYWLRNRGKSALDQERQDFRIQMPNFIRKKFNNEYSKEQWKSLARSLAHTDLATFSEEERNILFSELKNQGQSYLNSEIGTRIPSVLQLINAATNSQTYIKQAVLEEYVNTLAEYLATNKILNQKAFFKNPYAICAFLIDDWTENFDKKDEYKELYKQLDELITLKSLTYLSQNDFDTLTTTLNQDLTGVNEVLNMIQQFKANEEGKIDPHSYEGINAKLNAWKGFLPTSTIVGTSITIGRESQIDEYLANGYTVIKTANTSGTNLDQVAYIDQFNRKHHKQDNLVYFYSSMPRTSTFNEGTINIVLPTFFGSNTLTKHTNSDPHFTSISTIMGEEEFDYQAQAATVSNDGIAMVPVFNYFKGKGLITTSYDLFINDDSVMNRLEFQDYLPEMMGFWAGRQREEQVAMSYGMTCLNLILKSFDPTKEKEYINILDYSNLTPVQLDAVSRIPYNLRMTGSQMFEKKYGKKGIWIRKDLIKDVIGQRSASVMDLFNGITNLKPEHARFMKSCLQALCGNKAYQIAVGAEQAWQGLVSMARNMIVIKSVKVMMLNNFGNIYQLWMQGVPFTYILREIPRLLKESETYAQYGFEYQRLLVERDSTTDPVKKKKAQAQLDILDSKIRTLSIAPILSEFSTINDLGMDTEDLELMRGQVASWVIKQVNKLPKSMIIAGKHILMTKDTPQYQFLEKATQYGDFIAKGILYNYLTKVQKVSNTEARYRILDEFVNYGQLAGRTRMYLENMGLLWFFNYKLRIMKTAIRFVANHPFRALMMPYMPEWSPAGPTGNILSDSLLGKLLSGDLGFTIGPWMLFRGLTMHPILELLF